MNSKPLSVICLGYILLIFIFVVPQVEAAEPQLRLVGGENETTEHSYMTRVSAYIDGAYEPVCGGVLVAADMVLTAAECVTSFTADELQVSIGSSTDGRETRVVDEIYQHPDFDPEHFNAANFALLRLSAFSSLDPVAISYDESVGPEGDGPDIILDWEDDLPGKVEVSNLWLGEACRNDWQFETDLDIPANMVCAWALLDENDPAYENDPGTIWSAGTCGQSDLGAVLLKSTEEGYSLLGVSSYDFCGDLYFSSIFTSTYYEQDWLKTTIEENTRGSASGLIMLGLGALLVLFRRRS